jgi:hypothetical protein
MPTPRVTHSPRVFGLALTAAFAVACGLEPTLAPEPGSGDTAGRGSGGALAAGAGGFSGNAGHGGASGSAGLSGGAGSGGSSGGAGAAGNPNAGGGGVAGASGAGAAGAGFGGSSGGAGDGGLGGGAGAGTGGTPSNGGAAGTSAGAGGTEDLRAAAAVLDGFAILKPCVSSFRPSGNANNSGDCCCEELAANENQRITKQFGGTASTTYNVTLRVAGVAERYWYAGGTLDTASMLFYRGGLPTIHGPAPNNNLQPGQGACKIHPPETDGQFALPFVVPAEIRPSDGCYNGFNIFAMTVQAPGQTSKQSYYLNYTTQFDGVDRQPHSVYKTDYTVTIPIPGQAVLEFFTIDGDHHQVTNNGTMTVPNLRTAQPYNGNFLEFSVTNVARAN